MGTYRIEVLSLFPKSFDGLLQLGVIGRALTSGIAALRIFNPRDYTKNSYRQVDDEPYGGGVGMVLKPEPFFEAFDAIPVLPRRRVLMMTPQGYQPSQKDFRRWSTQYDQLVFICGQYEGFDERIRTLADEEISIGDFVLTGGELAAMSIINGVMRLLPGTVGRSESLVEESHSDLLLEHPHYTRPASFRNLDVPKILLSGNHSEIKKWRQIQRELRTRERRPELYEKWVEVKERSYILRKDPNGFNTLNIGIRQDKCIPDPWFDD